MSATSEPVSATATGVPPDGKSTTSTTPSSSPMNPWIYLCYGTIIGLWIVSRITIIPYVVHLLVLVTCILYVACHMSLALREEPHPDEKDSDGNPVQMEARETMRKEDAMTFPLVGSASLFSLYLAFKYLNKDWVNFLIGFYFGLVGCVAITMTIAPAMETLVGMFRSTKSNTTTTKKDDDEKDKKNDGFLIDFEYKKEHKLPEFLLGPSPFELSVQISTSELLAFLVSVAICSLYYFWKRPWYLNNILGICFCLQGIEKFSLGTYKIGAILLVGLFFYDIFWVFGTDVMVTVAKNLDGPIKILFPRSRTLDGKLELSLLGLGDIVIPGFFLSLLLRFDAHIAGVSVHYINVHESFPKPYFHSALFAYVLGLATTLFVMVYFQAAQPALLYLVPACLGSSLLCAVIRGELTELFDYSEEQEEVQEEKVVGKEKESEKTNDTTSTEEAPKGEIAKKDD